MNPFFCLFLAFLHHDQVQERQPLSKPNLVVFLIDDMGIMDTSVPFLVDDQGKPKKHPLNDFYKTPNLARLASRGTRFSQFYSMSVCSPSRVSLMTGQNSARHRTTNWINPDQDNRGPKGPPQWNWFGLGPGQITLARCLKTEGYRTIHVGKGHFGPRSSPGSHPTQLGFEVNVGGSSIGQPGSYFGKDHFAGGPKRLINPVPGLESHHGNEIFLTEALTIEARKQITLSVRDSKPFFLHMAHYAVHSPFMADPRFVPNYAKSGKPAAAQAYASLVEGVDHSLGQVLDHLETLGVAHNTLIVFLGDNGSDAPLGGPHEVACSAPLRGKKGSHYEGGMRVPFVAAWAKTDPSIPIQSRFPIQSGGVQSAIAAIYDLFPTLLELAQIPVPKDHVIDGQSLWTLLAGKTDPDHSQKFLMHYPHAPHRSDYFTVYRNANLKLIYHYFPTKSSNNRRYQLFDLGSDPYEQNDLAQENPADLGTMMKEMVTTLDQQKALFPVEAATGLPVRPVIPR